MDETPYREEMTWSVRFQATARFSETYDGDDDGFEWRKKLTKELQPVIATAIFRALSGLEGWKVRPGNRGLPVEDELLIHLEQDF